MKISPVFFSVKFNTNNFSDAKEDNAQSKQYGTYNSFGLKSKFNDHLVSFGTRVDKGLERFYEANKDRMPLPVKDYIESLENKKEMTPLEAQKNAFKYLESAKTIDDIKTAFSKYSLFDNLKEPSETGATRGILVSVKENEELLSLSNQKKKKNNENLTVYLVKKIFLEAKTLDEINQELEQDLDSDFKTDFKFKNPDSKYIHSKTLKALGIELPEREYLNSLRYTKDGYSDYIGGIISERQRAFWESLSDEERTSRAKKSVERFEKWWASLTKNEILDMIADQVTAIEMLDIYKKENKQKTGKEKTSGKNTEIKDSESKKVTKVGSQKLSSDELFVKWATNNLKLFESGLSDYEKDVLHTKRVQKLAYRWANMSVEEKIDYISKLKSGSEPLRYTMIDAWNHSFSLIKDLSEHLRESQIFKPADLLYSSQEFSVMQSQIMKEFWQKHPDYAVELGQNIINSQEKIKSAMSNGTFEALKKQIMREKSQRIKELEKYKSRTNDTQFVMEQLPEQGGIKEEFKVLYRSYFGGKLKSIPDNYFEDMYQNLIKNIPDDILELWVRSIKGEKLLPEESLKLQNALAEEDMEVAGFNRAIEAAMAEVVYEFTRDPAVYSMTATDLKVAMYHLEKGHSPIVLQSNRTGKMFNLNVLKKGKINVSQIAKAYEEYRKPLSDEEIDYIIKKYFVVNPSVEIKNAEYEEAYKALKEYIRLYGRTIFIIFSNKSAYSSEIKYAFNEKFSVFMPKILKEQKVFAPCLKSLNDYKNEQAIKQAEYLFEKRFSFVPSDVMDDYFEEAASFLRRNSDLNNLDYFINRICPKRKNSSDNAQIMIFPKEEMLTETKLKMLAFEQAMADILYESTQNTEVYSLPFEDLCDNIEIFSLVKHFPTRQRDYYSATNKGVIPLRANKKIDLGKMKQLYYSYMSEIKEWSKENSNKENPDYQDFLYILNPDENQPEKDFFIAKRMALYNYFTKILS